MGREVSYVACEPFKLVTSEQMWYMISVCVSSDACPPRHLTDPSSAPETLMAAHSPAPTRHSISLEGFCLALAAVLPAWATGQGSKQGSWVSRRHEEH